MLTRRSRALALLPRVSAVTRVRTPRLGEAPRSGRECEPPHPSRVIARATYASEALSRVEFSRSGAMNAGLALFSAPTRLPTLDCA